MSLDVLFAGQIVFNYLAIATGGHSINGLPVSIYSWVTKSSRIYGTRPLIHAPCTLSYTVMWTFAGMLSQAW